MKTNAPAFTPFTARRVLVPVDFSMLSRHALAYAGMLAEQFDARLSVLYVVEPPSFPEWGYAHLVIKERRLMATARQKLKEFCQQQDFDSKRIEETSVVPGFAPETIVDTAKREGADLIVMGTHGRSGLKHVLLGSVAERVARLAACPVLCLRQPALAKARKSAPVLKPRTILVATDFSANSREAFAPAIALAQASGARIVLLHVVPSTLPAEFSHVAVVLETKRLVRESRPALEKLRQSAFPEDVAVETLVLDGNPAHEICRIAAAAKADLSVVSTHGHTGLKHLWLGSVAERVLRHAPCPVLVMRGRDSARHKDQG